MRTHTVVAGKNTCTYLHTSVRTPARTHAHTPAHTHMHARTYTCSHAQVASSAMYTQYTGTDIRTADGLVWVESGLL